MIFFSLNILYFESRGIRYKGCTLYNKLFSLLIYHIFFSMKSLYTQVLIKLKVYDTIFLRKCDFKSTYSSTHRNHNNIK